MIKFKTFRVQMIMAIARLLRVPVDVHQSYFWSQDVIRQKMERERELAREATGSIG